MTTPRIHIDTPVIGGCLDAEFQSWSNLLLQRALDGDAIAIISSATVDALQDTPSTAFAKLPPHCESESDLGFQCGQCAAGRPRVGVVQK